MAEGKRLRVLVVGLTWPAETFLCGLLKGLAEAGVEVTLASAERPGEDWSKHAGFRWLRTPAWRGFAAKRLMLFLWLLLRAMLSSAKDVYRFASDAWKERSAGQRLEALNRLLPYAGHHWDAIYIPWNSAAITHLPLFELDCPVVVSCRGSQINIAPHNPKRSAIKQGLRVSFQRAAAVHCVSEAIKHEAALYGLQEKKAKVIYPAVNPNIFRPEQERRRPDDGTYRIVTTGALQWVKGYEYALLAVRHLIDSGIPASFEIIGDGPERQRLLYTIHDLQLAPHVHLYGRLTPKAVRERLRSADVFLLSSLSEGVSNAVLEAMACGLPVVTTDCGGMREAVTDSREGFVVPVRDWQAIAEALSKLFGDTALRARMGETARARVLRQFDLAEQVRQFTELFVYAAEAAKGGAE